MIMTKYFSIGILFALLLCGCGQTGPLYLPDAPPPIHVEPEPDPEPEEDTDDDPEEELQQ